jgi:hypothetical protein
MERNIPYDIMDDEAFDELISMATNIAAEKDYLDSIPEGYVAEPSKAHARRMRKMLEDPMAYLRHQRRPLAMKVLRTAAAVVLSLGIALGTTMLASTEVRATVSNVFMAWFDDHAVYKTTSPVLGCGWEIGYVTEGYTRNDELSLENEAVLSQFFENEKDAYIDITITSGTAYVDNEHQRFSQTTINGNTADVYESFVEGHGSIVVVYWEKYSALVCVTSFEDIGEVIKMAESVKPIEGVRPVQ